MYRRQQFLLFPDQMKTAAPILSPPVAVTYAILPTRPALLIISDTGNSCRHPGYAEFNPPSWPRKCAPQKSNWITLDPPMCGLGDGYPEEFWNCADIRVTAGALCRRDCGFFLIPFYLSACLTWCGNRCRCDVFDWLGRRLL